MKIYLGADHAGFARKEKIKKYLAALGYRLEDLGNDQLRPRDDYPDFAHQVAGAVAKNPTRDRGILLCDSGTGMAIAANRHPKIRAANVWNRRLAILSRTDNDSNILCLAAQHLSWFKTKSILRAWLTTDFSEAKRHRRRRNKL